MWQKVVKVLGGDPNKREIERLSSVISQINDMEASYEKLSNDELRSKTAEFHGRLKEGETLDAILPEAFAAVREASKRTIGLRHYDVQMIGGMVLNSGKIAEMRTGEGKTLVATLPLYLNAVRGQGAHLVTVNDYLARRDARWMAPIYQALGLSVGVLQMAARTENGRKAFLVDLSKTSPQEDQNQLKLVLREEAYKADITYGTNSEYGFDYLRDNLTMSLEERVQRGHHFAIVDEVDNILIDEARTPLIISGPASEDTEWYLRMSQIVRQLNPDDYEINEKDRAVSLTELGEVHVEELLDIPLRDPERPEDITPEQARLLGYLEQSLRAQHLYRRNKDYLVQAGKVVIVDEFTGRLMPGRRWSEGLHQAVEAKEGVKVEPENVTYATITLQNYFRMFEKLAGMTGTASTESEEFSKIYKLEVVTIPMNLEYMAMQTNADLSLVEKKDLNGYKYSYYARKEHPEQPVFWKRQDFPDVVYRSEEAKLRAITQEIMRYHVIGRPQLVGTTSVEHSERLSRRLMAEPLKRLLQTLLVRQAYLDKNNLELIEKSSPELQVFNKTLDTMDVAELRPLARSLNVSLNLEDSANVSKLIKIISLSEADAPRLLKAIQAGIQHQVLNARKHDEESQIIAGAGAFGAVTIATNMAGRGVDIKLGGDLPETILQDTNRILARFHADPYDFTNDEREKALLALPVEEYGIYEEAVRGFMEYMDNMDKVRTLGGLHVIGSERHEARRIDNQLRGRSARQGDPGSSRFYLSLEDELMRLFGGPQVENLWKRIFFDESLPLEMNLLGRMVEQSQERVEGANFDIRKHLLEYDDVLNSQRKRIYSQRDMVFKKENLTEDILDMLSSEMKRRIPLALKDEEGPWKLLAYLDEIQPAFSYQTINMPSFTIRLLHDDIRQAEKETGSLRSALLKIAEKALQAEKDHMLYGARRLLEQALESLQTQREERNDTLDIFLEGIRSQQEEGLPPKTQELQVQLNESLRMQVKLQPDQLRSMLDGDEDVVETIRQQIQQYLTSIAVNRAIGALERRLEDSLGIRSLQLGDGGWRELSEQVIQAAETTFDKKMDKLLGDNGQIAADLASAGERLNEASTDDSSLTPLLVLMSQGTRLTFDSRTHRKGSRAYTRINYVYLMASIMEGSEPEDITERVLAHLVEALSTLEKARGISEYDHLIQNEISLRNVDTAVQEKILTIVGEEQYEKIVDVPVGNLGVNSRSIFQEVIGSRLQNEAYRELLLRVISEQWVEYLTQVEALRVSIGMEAYAQRDPLVQYKGRATELFGALLTDIRTGVVSRVFTYHPRRGVAVNNSPEREKAPETGAPALPLPTHPRSAPVQVNKSASPTDRGPHPAGTPPTQRSGEGGKKRKRH